jgi:large subunit ribosomal protein L10
MPTPQKEARVAELRAAVESSKAIYLADFAGIPAGLMAEIRGKLIEAGAEVSVVKNRLLNLALQGTGNEALSAHLEGPTVATFAKTDALAPARVTKDIVKGLAVDKQTWALKAAMVEGRLFEGAQAVALGDLPPVDQIKSEVVGAINGPLSSVVGALNGVLRDVVYTLQAVADKRSEAA